MTGQPCRLLLSLQQLRPEILTDSALGAILPAPATRPCDGRAKSQESASGQYQADDLTGAFALQAWRLMPGTAMPSRERP
jgi:hypothetical protein